jgi:hypothetical protein
MCVHALFFGRYAFVYKFKSKIHTEPPHEDVALSLRVDFGFSYEEGGRKGERIMGKRRATCPNRY